MSKVVLTNICWGLIKGSAKEVSRLFENDLKRIRISTSTREGLVNWSSFFEEQGESFSVFKVETALLACRHGWTMYLSNASDGWSSLFGNVVASARADAFFFRTTVGPDVRYRVHGMVAWQGGAETRFVRALQDDPKWEFLERGVPLPFEETSRYRARRIRDRMDEAMIRRYSAAAGAELPDFPIERPVLHIVRI